MSTVDFLAQEKIWFEKPRYDEAERRFYERMNGSSQTAQVRTLAASFSLPFTALRFMSQFYNHVHIVNNSPDIVSEYPLKVPTVVSKYNDTLYIDIQALS